nr:2-hydroxyacid dehydrogenase [uncultured Pseudomonas sp.]
MKVLCLWYANAEEQEIVRDTLGHNVEILAPVGNYLSRYDCDFTDVKDLLPEADAILAFSVPSGALELARNLKFFSWLHSGVDDLSLMGALQLFRTKGVRLANVRGANAIAVAEQATMFMLALAKRTLLKHQATTEGRFLFPLYADDFRSGMLSGRTVGIIGTGNIGSRIAKHAKGFEMSVIGLRRSKSNDPLDNFDEIHTIDKLKDILPELDYVIIAAPDTKETHQLFGASELSAMKTSAYLINVSRGMIVQEKPLYDALVSNAIAGFATDVWWQYNYGQTFPIGWGSRLGIQKLNNVVLSNDQAANADDVLQRNIKWGSENLRQFLSGEEIKREVNLNLGY